jgi:2-oxoglutarate/2-oxoacid ferredoxin oxidoreductase subunit alpha
MSERWLSLLDMELTVLTDSLHQPVRKNPKLAEPTSRPLNSVTTTPASISPTPANSRCAAVTGWVMRSSWTATAPVALGALYAGATVVGWYPITPSTSIIEAFGRYAEQFRIEPETGRIKAAIVQAEDELAAIGIVIGASWNGARAFTATSGPGISLMAEFLGLAYFAEIPAVLINVQRAGPSTGMPTRTQQSDLLACAYASHGDTRIRCSSPATPRNASR